MESEIHLSLVATSRNDNHGGYLTQRMQHFVDGFIAQCKRHAMRAELIMVEWNPPRERRPLAEELAWPADCGTCEIRIVTVPRELHDALPHGDKLPLFQMIAKNVGIRRARGRFVLATNIDILFSDGVMRRMRDRLRDGHLYRVERHDVPTHVPASADFDRVLEFCEREAFRRHVSGFTLFRRDGRWQPRSALAAKTQSVWQTVVRTWRRAWGGGGPVQAGEPSRENLRPLRRTIWLALRSLQWFWHAVIRRELFTNACGDFTLLSRADWFALRGYPEWPVYSWNIDSILLYQAHRSRIREIYLGDAAPVYHIEHSPGSGFTPESPDKLFERLAALGIPYLDWERDMEPKIREMDRARARGEFPIVYNDADWGLARHSLPEQRVGAGA